MILLTYIRLLDCRQRYWKTRALFSYPSFKKYNTVYTELNADSICKYKTMIPEDGRDLQTKSESSTREVTVPPEMTKLTDGKLKHGKQRERRSPSNRWQNQEEF